MKYFLNSLFFTGLFALLPTAIFAQNLSFQGATGILNTPDAMIIDEGVFSYQFNNYIEDDRRSENTSFYNHVFSVGLSPYLEIGGRLTDYTPNGETLDARGALRGTRDLSGNIKVKLPKILPWQPNIALGMNDFAGNAVNFRSQYIVASETLEALHYSVGYATGDNVNFNGGFANVSYDINQSLSLLGEYDTNAFNLGVNYDLSSLTKLPLSIKASTAIDNELNNDLTVGLSFTVPLDTQKLTKKKNNNNTTSSKPLKRSLQGSETDRINDLMHKLAHYGFEQLKIGRHTATGHYVIAAENRIYNHNHMDGVALILGIAHEFLADKETLQIVLSDRGSAVFAVQTAIQPYARYITYGKAPSEQAFKQQLKIWFPEPKMLSSSARTIQWFDGVNKGVSPYFDIKFQPAFRTTVGHEFGLFDYSLALQTDVSLSLWKGANLLVSGDIFLDESTNYKDGKPFADGRHESDIKQILAQQHYKPHKNVSTLSSVGRVDVNKNLYDTIQSEARWVSDTGTHQIAAKLAHFEPENTLQDDRQLAIASYGYFIPDRDLSFEASYGEFFEGDVGARYQLKKQFGDTEVGLFLSYIDDNDISGGISITLPLTPRRDYKNKVAIVRGTQALNYNLGTTIEHPTRPGTNGLRPNVLLEPKPANSLSRDHLDANRLTQGYFNTHLNRVREAYFTLTNTTDPSFNKKNSTNTSLNTFSGTTVQQEQEHDKYKLRAITPALVASKLNQKRYHSNNTNNKIAVMGVVEKSGNISYNQRGMSLSDAISNAKGLKESAADPTAVFVLRQDKKTDKKLTVYQLDVSSDDAFLLAEQFNLRSQDVVYVTDTDSSLWDDIINQILPSAMLFAHPIK